MSDQPTGDNSDLLNFIASTVEMIRDRMATKDDIARLDAKIDSAEARLSEKIDVEITAVRGDIEQAHLRLNSIDRAISSRLEHVEADMSRMRSVLYLLVRDDPAMLRLLGYEPPSGG
ncbi:MAG TPA: hypothetical protein VGX48_00020 [Pyrinomonadaceae bacterium]|nr:hypothetical protein [Pyrinomonadaceae bacterium]